MRNNEIRRSNGFLAVILSFMGVMTIFAIIAHGAKRNDFMYVRFVNRTNHPIRFWFSPEFPIPVCDVPEFTQVPAGGSVDAGGIFFQGKLSRCAMNVTDENGFYPVSFDPFPYFEKGMYFDSNNPVTFIRDDKETVVIVPKEPTP